MYSIKVLPLEQGKVEEAHLNRLYPHAIELKNER